MTNKVVELDVGFKPEAAVSGAVLVQSEVSTFLTFNAMKQEEDGLWHPAGTAFVRFPMCLATKFGHPNDEALPGHPLYSMMQGYGIYEVIDSTWVDELTRLNQVRFPQTDPGRWKSTYHHFIFTFHDSTFECLANEMLMEILVETYETIFQRITQHILSE